MSKEIIISVAGEQSRIAIVENGELVELYVENPDNVRTIGDIYLSRVRRILPGIRAAFVDIGHKQDAFLHFSDLSDNLPELIELSQGKVPEGRPKQLTKAPEDPAGNLELESAEEQLATARRRDIKRSRGEGRSRGRGKAKPGVAETEGDAEAEAPETVAPEAAAKADEATPRRRSRGRKADEAKASEAPQGEAPATPSAPSILPPDAEQATPLDADDTDSAVAEESAPAPEGRADAEEPPKERSRRRRGGRRRRGRGEQESGEAASDQDEAPAAEPEVGEPPSQEAEADAKPARSRRRKKDEPEADADAQEQEEAPKRRRSRSRKAENQEAREDQPSDGPSRTDEPEASSAPAKAAGKTDEKPAEPAETTSGPTRLARSSRFVIDLTAKPGRASAPRREEEEEEEEEAATSRRSRGSRKKASGGERKRAKDGGKENNNGGRGARNDEADDEDDDEGKPTGRTRDGKPPDAHLKQDQKLLVKIIKEPISAKGSRVSTDISLAGRFLVLIPAADYVAVSKKIESSKERRRLRALARSLLPEGYGLIVRTVAEGRDAKALDIDLQLLLKRWRKVEDQLKQKPDGPVRLYEDVNMVSSIVRDLFSEDYDRIIVDDAAAFRTVKSYVQAVAPQMADSVQLYKGAEPVFRANKIEKEVRAAFESRVSLPGGGYLFIETTEAMHVVDVNSGRAGRGLSQEENALRVNLEAAREIAKQLRLRDLGGIICVDFIDMRSDSYRKKVYDELKREFKRDRAVTKLLPMSDFGVVEITRQRLRPSITTTLDVDDLGPAPPDDESAAPLEEARAEARSERAAEGPQPTAAEVVAHLERWLTAYREGVSEQHRKRPVLLRVHPFLAAYLQRGIPSLLTRWKFKTWLNFRLDVDESAAPLSFSVRDEKSGKNLTRKYDPDREG